MSSKAQYRTCKKCGRRFLFPNEWNKHLNDPVEYQTEERHRKLSESLKKGFANGRVVWIKGKKMSDETRLKLSKLRKGRIPWNKGKRFVIRTEEERLSLRREYDRAYRAKNRERLNEALVKRRSKNREKLNAKSRERRKLNLPRRLEIERKWRETHPENLRETWLRTEHGISLAQFELIKNSQGNDCGICHSVFNGAKDTHVDHSHITDQIRGILCHNCNVALGKFKDNPQLLRNAIDYLLGKAAYNLDDAALPLYAKQFSYNKKATDLVRSVLLPIQNNCCAVCRNLFDKLPWIDHDHVTLKIRGLLCASCNQGLGLFKDDVLVIRSAIVYLEAGGIPEIKSILAAPNQPEPPSTPTLLASNVALQSEAVPIDFAEFAKNWFT